MERYSIERIEIHPETNVNQFIQDAQKKWGLDNPQHLMNMDFKFLNIQKSFAENKVCQKDALLLTPLENLKPLENI